MPSQTIHPLPEHIPHLFRIAAGTKIPIAGVSWKEGHADQAMVDKWIEEGHNLGLRTGSASGIYVVDVDSYKPDCAEWTHTDGPSSETANGGAHYLFKYTQGGNTAGKLGKHIDTRGEGGYILYPGSKLSTGGEYTWRVKPTHGLPDCPLVWLPAKPIAIGPMAERALLKECHIVRTSVQGERNHRLNTAAFNIGQLVFRGDLGEEYAREALAAAARMTGLGETEIQATISSGFKGGAENPRENRSVAGAKAVAETETAEYILTPGAHANPVHPYRPITRGTDAFCDEVVRKLPPDAIYKRGGMVGEILERAFSPIEGPRMRTIVDKHVSLGFGKPGKGDEPASFAFRSCSADLGNLLVAYAKAEGGVRDLKFLANHPIYVEGTDNVFRLAKKGWDHHAETYITCDIPKPLSLKESRAVLDDLLVDFPFKDKSDKANFIGLMLTPLLRPAIGEPVPFHLIGSPIERSGKTKLAEIVLGCGVLGDPTAAMQLGVREEEIEKRITSLLLAGITVAHLDNMREFTDSPSLASLLTSNVWMGRILSQSVLARIVNTLTLVGTGNNVHATGEIAKRVVPIMLMPLDEAPELRTDFRHPQLKKYVTKNRERIRAALLGLVDHWVKQNKPDGPIGFGGFERWSWMVGGIMRAAGYREWLENLAEWRGTADDFSSEAKVFVKRWHRLYGDSWVKTDDLFKLAVKFEVLEPTGKNDAGLKTSFGKTISKLANRVINGHTIQVKGSGGKRSCKLKGQPD